MAVTRVLTVICIAAFLTAFAAAARAAETETVCTTEDVLNQLCVTATVDDDVDTVELDGTASGDSSASESEGGDGGPSSARINPEILTGSSDGITFNCADFVSELCTTVRRAPRVSDLVSFGAAAPMLTMEPDGWAAVGLPTNFIASAAAHERHGLLLGAPASVQFIPVGYRFDFGDGTTVSSSTGGDTWGALGVDEFERTPTSHTYAERGTFTISASVLYRARFAYDSTGDWFDIPGTLSVDATTTARAYTIDTVLVSRTCQEDPSGVGC
ncbi:PKD domain-containing protein [Salinibacterium sp. GXW1014]|uniref:PKD domain-containing protein n=1 Tax=Salinibacterium sp. GXW1014 TaxID=3377838 RepID=UPI00383A1A66